MHCPNCGQKQVSIDTRFCSRCGFQLAIVAELILNGGALPRLETIKKESDTWLTRKNGLVFSLLWFLIFVFLLTPLSAIADLGELPAFTAILGVFGGLILLLASLLLLKGPRRTQFALPQHFPPPASLYGTQSRGELESTWTPSAQDYVSGTPGDIRVPDTGELVHPGSVTENTTKLLRKEDK